VRDVLVLVVAGRKIDGLKRRLKGGQGDGLRPKPWKGWNLCSPDGEGVRKNEEDHPERRSLMKKKVSKRALTKTYDCPLERK